MKTLIAYDTAYGNTEAIALHIASALDDAEARRIDSIDPGALPSMDLLVVGSPTQAGQATPAMRRWLSQLPQGGLKDVRVGAFDTRLAVADQTFALRALLGPIGYAAPKILYQLVARGGISGGMAGFLVEGAQGPLRAGELQSSKQWATTLATSATSRRAAA